MEITLAFLKEAFARPFWQNLFKTEDFGSTKPQNYPKVLGNLSAATITKAEHLLDTVRGAALYDTAGNECEACIKIDAASQAVYISSNINLLDHLLLIY